MMGQARANWIATRVVGRLFLTLTGLGLWALAGQASAVLRMSPTSITLPVGTYATVKISGARGEIQAETTNTAVSTVTLTNVSSSSATLNVFGKGAGNAIVYVRDARTPNISLPVKVTASTAMTVSPTSVSLSVGATATINASNFSGAVSATSANKAIANVSVSANVVTVTGVTAGGTVVAVKDSKTTVNVPVTVLGSSVGAGKYTLIAWNDLGMHCVDGRDYSIFSILPPFNNLHAQLVNASTGKVVTTGVVLTYEAIADATGSINTSSAGKTNFWKYVKPLYNAAPTPDVGLTGNPTPSLVASPPMVLNPTYNWFEATGIPITPYDDAGAKNFYPTVKVTAKDSTGKVLATTVTVLPVSDEITCVACHASQPASVTNSAQQKARPKVGWVFDPDPLLDWKKNILRLHDEKFTTSLLSQAQNGTPSLCASCHASNALPGTGKVGIPALTSSLHTTHGKVIDPTTITASTPAGLMLDSIDNRSACYMCHPGSVTKCLRGVMGNAVDANGNMLINCQSCHSTMTKVGDPTRMGWLQQPNCQACHYNSTRTLSAVDSSGNLIVPADTRFATNVNTPGPGFSLYRFSKGHGGLQCESCHGATHAEYPSSHDNDNLQSIALQGYAGTLRECTVCHTTPPLTANGGPHGMHTVGAAWVGSHGDQVSSAGGPKQCAYCHGADYKGSPLAQVKAPRTFNVEDGAHSYKAGQNVTCYDCHNGPNP